MLFDATKVNRTFGNGKLVTSRGVTDILNEHDPCDTFYHLHGHDLTVTPFAIQCDTHEIESGGVNLVRFAL